MASTSKRGAKQEISILVALWYNYKRPPACRCISPFPAQGEMQLKELANHYICTMASIVLELVEGIRSPNGVSKHARIASKMYIIQYV